MLRISSGLLNARAALDMSVVAAVLWLCMSVGYVQASVVTWVTPPASNSNATFTVNANYTTNYGIAFTTGASGPFSIDFVTIGLSSSTIGGQTGTFKVSLRNTTNTTAYSAAAGSTEYAVDTVSYTEPATTPTNFDLALTASQLPNISAYEMAANTSYALIIYDASLSTTGIQRTTGFAQGSTNDQYTVAGGFSMLNTFKNNNQFTNNASSYPTLSITFGGTSGQPSGQVPEPTSLAIFGLGSTLALLRARRRK